MKSVKEAIDARHTTKRYKEGPEITNEQIMELIDAAYKSPSANNLQDSEIVVVKSQKEREAYAEQFDLTNNRTNIKQAQALFILKGTPWKMELLDNGQRLVDVNIKYYGIPEDVQQKVKEGVIEYYSTKSGYSDSLDIYTSAIQFSFMVLRATEMGFQTTPMLGINKPGIEKFMLERGDLKQGQRVNLAFTVGYEDEDHELNKEHKFIRQEKENYFKIK